MCDPGPVLRIRKSTRYTVIQPPSRVNEKQLHILKALMSYMGLTVTTLEPYSRRARCPHITREHPVSKLTMYEANRLIDVLLRTN
jgi:hypothetical protein